MGRTGDRGRWGEGGGWVVVGKVRDRQRPGRVRLFVSAARVKTFRGLFKEQLKGPEQRRNGIWCVLEERHLAAAWRTDHGNVRVEEKAGFASRCHS